ASRSPPHLHSCPTRRSSDLLGIGLSMPAMAEDAPAAAPEGVPPAESATCTKVEFESAVDSAAESLRDLNNRNRPEFQSKLRQLRSEEHTSELQSRENLVCRL